MSSSRSRPEAPIRRLTVLLLLLGPTTGTLSAQRLDWRTRAVFYADNTEFFTSYRVGETILGGQLSTWIEAAPGPRTQLHIGIFADRRWGSEEFADSVKPILSFHYTTLHSNAVLGVLETVRRHGLLDPVMVSTRELTTPIEYGLQYVESRGIFRGEAWVNWQRLNTQTQREAFELGLTANVDATDWLRVQGQHLWSHRGGQLYSADVAVSNNHVTGVGATLHRKLPHVGESSLAVWQLFSSGHIDPGYPKERPDQGYGTYFRAGVTPLRRTELFAIHWIGTDYNADAGDNNYNSTGHTLAFYQSHRTYTELGILHRTPVEAGITLDAEARWHRIDHEDSIAFFGTPWEFSYRLIVRVPLDIVVRSH